MNRSALITVLMLTSAAIAAEPRRDRFGDPLPDGAIARLGTTQAHVGVEGIGFSAEGKSLISWSRHGVRHWDAATGRITHHIERRLPAGAWLQVVSADGRIAAIVWRDRMEVRDVETDRLRHRVELPRFENMMALEVSARGERAVVSLLAPANKGGVTIAVRTDTGTVERWPNVVLFRSVLAPNGERIAGIEIVDGKRRICCRGSDGKRLWQLPFDGRPIAFTPDGASLLARDEDQGELVLVDSATGARRDATLPRTDSNPAAAFSIDGRLLAVNTPVDITLWDLRAGKALHRWPGRASGLAFAPDGRRLAATNDLMRCWDVQTGKPVWPDFGPAISRNHHHASFFSRPVGKLLTLWDDEARRLQVWDWTTGKPIFVSPTVDCRTREAMWLTPDGTRACICTDRRVIGWEIPGGKEIPSFSAKPQDLMDLDWYVARESHDGKAISVLLPRRNENDAWRAWLVRWDVATGHLVDRREIDARFRDYLRIDPDGRHISDREQLRDAVTGRQRTVASAPSKFEIATPLEFSADGRLALGHLRPEQIDGSCEVIVWEVATAKPLLRHVTGQHQLVQAALSPDDRWLAMAARESIELWDLATGQRVAELRHRTPDVVQAEAVYYCLGLMFLPGHKLIAAYGDRTALVWNLPPETEKPPPQRIGERTWDDLASTEPRPAQDAVWALVNDPAKAIALLREKLKPAAAVPDGELAALVAELAGTDFGRREAAYRRLHELGHQIEKSLVAALAKAANAEQARRLKLLLDLCRDDGPHSADERRAVRAVQAVGLIDNADARALLESWSKGAETAMLTIESKRALKR